MVEKVFSFLKKNLDWFFLGFIVFVNIIMFYWNFVILGFWLVNFIGIEFCVVKIIRLVWCCSFVGENCFFLFKDGGINVLLVWDFG